MLLNWRLVAILCNGKFEFVLQAIEIVMVQLTQMKVVVSGSRIEEKSKWVSWIVIYLMNIRDIWLGAGSLAIY